MAGPTVAETGVVTEGFSIALPMTTGHFHLGKFDSGDPQYTIENEVVAYEQIDEGGTRPNVVVVDGNTDSWTEYDRADLLARDTAVNLYLDLPELMSSGEVRQRAVEEIDNARKSSSPGGEVVWQPWFTKMDRIWWVDEDGNRYETRIEGLRVSGNQGFTPFQRATIDTGLLVFCPPELDSDTYIARDLFDRDTTDGMGNALTGGTWVIYS